MGKVFLGVHWRFALSVAALSSAFSWGPSARAELPASQSSDQSSEPDDARSPLPFRVDLHGVLTWEAEFGTGLRADIPLLRETRVHEGHDELALSVGLDLSFVTFGGENRVTFWPTVAAQWSLNVSERFVFYPEVGIVAQLRPGDFEGLFPNVGFGTRFTVRRSLAVLARLGWPMAVNIGLTY